MALSCSLLSLPHSSNTSICEAASRPQMHFVPIKTIDQQSMLCIHRLREGFKEERTACTNRIRGLLAEFGLLFPQKSAVLRQTEQLAGVGPVQAGKRQWWRWPTKMHASCGWCSCGANRLMRAM